MEITKYTRGAKPFSKTVWKCPLYFEQGGSFHESFVIDASGLLVRICPDEGSSDTLIPYACDAWVIDQRQRDFLEAELLRRFHPGILSNEKFSRLYHDGIPHHSNLYAPRVDSDIDADLVEKAIEAYDETSQSIQQEIEEELSQIGVFRFEFAGELSTDYLSYEGVKINSAKVVAPGWFSASRIFRKAMLS